MIPVGKSEKVEQLVNVRMALVSKSWLIAVFNFSKNH